MRTTLKRVRALCSVLVAATVLAWSWTAAAQGSGVNLYAQAINLQRAFADIYERAKPGVVTVFAETRELTLFIDMGTNGEIVLGNDEWLTCCSCSAGPAFEGSGIEHGMYATVGAIERLSYDPDTDRVEYATIGGARPRAVIPVHLYGHPADMTTICETARRHHLLVIDLIPGACAACAALVQAHPHGHSDPYTQGCLVKPRWHSLWEPRIAADLPADPWRPEHAARRCLAGRCLRQDGSDRGAPRACA